MAQKHQGQIEEQALIANIERHRQLITQNLLEPLESGEISVKIRRYLAASPFKLTSTAVLAGLTVAILLRNSSRRRSHIPGIRRTVFRWIKWLINQAGNPSRNTEKGLSGVLAPLGRHFADAIWSVFK